MSQFWSLSPPGFKTFNEASMPLNADFGALSRLRSRTQVQRVTFACKEFEPVLVPLDYLLVKGEFTLYPEAERFFDLDFRDGSIVVAPKSFVGLIPVNDRVEIHVLPRFPITNLFHILHRSSATLKFIEGHVRTYSVIDGGDAQDPIGLLADQLTQASNGVRRSGLLRRYSAYEHEGLPSGTIDFPQTVSRFRTAGIRHKQVWHRTEHSVQLRENQLIKLALQKLLSYYATIDPKRLGDRMKVIREALFLFDAVSLPVGPVQFTEHELATMVKKLPGSHRQYGPLLWLSFLIHSRKGIALEQSGTATFDTFVVNMADVFEDYVRILTSDAAEHLVAGSRAKNGNVEQVNLFVEGTVHKVKPDIYLRRGTTNVAVLDAKYKPHLKASDRYEVLAFCEALSTKKAVLISPSNGYVAPLLLGKTPGSVEVWIVKIDLASGDMLENEKRFVADLATTLA